MWYNPVPPINQATYRLKVGGLIEKPQEMTVAQLRSFPQVSQSSRMKCVRQGDRARARDILQQLQQELPESSLAQTAEGARPFHEGKYAEAEAPLQKSASAGIDPTASALLALTQAATGRCADAEPALKRSFGHADVPNVRRRFALDLARCLTASRRLDESLALLYRLKTLYPDDADVVYETARGLAIGHLDNDGAVEAVVNSQNEKPALLKLANKPAGNWLSINLSNAKTNRSAIGAKVRVTAGGHTQLRQVTSGGSYLS